MNQLPTGIERAWKTGKVAADLLQSERENAHSLDAATFELLLSAEAACRRLEKAAYLPALLACQERERGAKP